MRHLALLLVLACGHAQHAGNAHLALADLEIYEGGESVVHLLADGMVQVLEKGTVNGTPYEEWKTVGKIAADGTITAANGQTSHIPDDVTSDAWVTGGRRMTIAADGAVLLDGKPFGHDKLVRVRGVSDATRRTALLLLALTLHTVGVGQPE